MEGAVYDGHNASVLLKVLPPFYEAMAIPEREAKIERLQQRALFLLMKEKQYAKALDVLRTLPNRNAKMEAICHEGLGDFRSAAEAHVANKNLKAALACYRSIPDLESALKLAEQMPDHPAAESLRWMAEMQRLVSKRPEKFTKMVAPARKNA